MSDVAVAPTVRDNLGSRAVRGVLWVAGSRGAGQAIQFLSGIALSRLLTPRDFGLIASAYVFAGFANLLTDLGLGTAIVQRREVTEQHLSSAFWLNAVTGVALTLLVGALSPFIADVMHAPELRGLTWLIALNFTLSMTVVPFALLERAMRFRVISIIEISASALGWTSAIVGAATGLGYYSLALATLVQTAATSTGAIVAARWVPKARPTVGAARELWRFGGWLTAHNMVEYWSSNTGTLLISATQSKATVGFYNRAYNLMLLPVNQVTIVLTRVMVPAMSALQDDDERTRSAYSRALGLTALCTFPLLVGIAATAPALVESLWGNQWTSVAPYLQVLSIAGIPWCLTGSAGWILVARGRTRRLFVVGVLDTAATIIGFAIGIHWGAMGVAVSLLVKAWLIAPVILGIGLHLVHGRLRDLVPVVVRPAVAAGLMGAAVWVEGQALHALPPLLVCAAQLVTGAVAYLLLARTVAHPQAEVMRAVIADQRRFRTVDTQLPRPPQAASGAASTSSELPVRTAG